MEYDSYSPEDTFQIAYDLGRQASPGNVLCLIGDLGVGKTLFSQGFAKGLGIEESVNSPTFTIVQEYRDGRIPFYHFDVYRIEDPDEMEEIDEWLEVMDWAYTEMGIDESHMSSADYMKALNCAY